MRHFAVLGSPIEHSLSPVLQTTAFRILGFDADYGRAEVHAGGLRAFIDGLDDDWAGLSLTMPLKREVMPLLDEVSPLAERLGVANTLVISRDGGRRRLAGHNTDIDGIVRAITALHGVAPRHATILGGGATAASALAAAARLGATSATLWLRDPSRGAEVVPLAAVLGVELEVAPLADVGNSGTHDFVIGTLPGGVSLPHLIPESPTSVLLDVAYDPWPSPLANAWQASGGSAVSGLDMLVEQAVGQIRLFTGRAQDAELPHEPEVRRAMREAVGLAAD